MKVRYAINKTVKITAVLIFILLFYSSCKKKEIPKPVPVNNPVVLSPYSASTSNLFSGFFTTVQWKSIKSGTIIASNFNATVFFYSTPINLPSGDPILKVNSIQLNNTIVNYDTTYLMYKTNQPTNFFSQLWQINGSNGIPSFNYSNTNYPTCINFDVTPDSISKSNSLTININGVSGINTNNSTFVLFDGFDTSINIQRALNNGDNTLTFTPSELSIFNITTGGSFGTAFIFLENSQNLNFYGKDFQFTKQNQCSSPIKFVP